MRPRTLLLVAGLATLVSAVALGSASPPPQSETGLRERARALHQSAIVVDTHADLTPLVEKDARPAMIDDPGLAGSGYDAADAASRRRRDNKWLHGFPPGSWSFLERHTTGYMDLPRMREGGLDAQFFAVYTEEDERPGMAVKTALSQIGAIRTMAAKYPKDVALAVTAQDVRSIVGSGRVALLMGVEGGHMIDDDLNVLRAFAALGVRYFAPTHSFNTHWADSSGVGPPVEPAHGGLSPFGREVVREMNRLGVLADVSHVADKTFFDVLEVTKAPVIASHSAVDAVKQHARNMSDDMLRALARNGGVIQVDGVLKYIVQAPERYAAHVQKGQPVIFTVDAFGTNQFEGKVFLISPQVNTTTRAFAFGALVQNRERKLRANTFARGELVLERNVPTPVVPLDAVVSFVGISKVFVVENNAAKPRTVEVGRVINNQQEILSGVKPGESIVVSGQSKLYDGARVRVKEPNAK